MSQLAPSYIDIATDASTHECPGVSCSNSFGSKTNSIVRCLQPLGILYRTSIARVATPGFYKPPPPIWPDHSLDTYIQMLTLRHETGFGRRRTQPCALSPALVASALPSLRETDATNR